MSSVILDKPGDWFEWIFIVKLKARQFTVEKLIDPESATEPPAPIVTKFLRTSKQAQHQSWSSAQPS